MVTRVYLLAKELGVTSKELADRWRAHNWGPPTSRFYSRSDQTNARTGERAVMVRGTSDGALPGVFTAIPSMPPAKYELRFWAAADIGEKATLYAHLAGEDLGPQTVGEDWVEVKFTVEVKEKKQSNAPLRLWTTTSGVKVWFDDVEVTFRGRIEAPGNQCRDHASSFVKRHSSASP